MYFQSMYIITLDFTKFLTTLIQWLKETTFRTCKQNNITFHQTLFALWSLHSGHIKWPQYYVCSLFSLAPGNFRNNDVGPLMSTLNFFDLQCRKQMYLLISKTIFTQEACIYLLLFPWVVLFSIESFLFTEYNRI